MTGVLGRLPPWPRNALNPSVIAAEQAYRKRSGLPLLSDDEVECLKTGQPLPWEAGNGASAPATSASAAVAAAPAVAATATAVAEASGDAPSALADELKKSGRKWNSSAVLGEQTYRRKKGMPLLTDADIAYLLGQEAPAAAASAEPAVAAPAASAAGGGAPSPLADELKKSGRKWNSSAVLGEQTYRRKKGMPLLTDADIAYLLGQEAPATVAAPVAAAAPATKAAAAAPARAPAPAIPKTPPLRREGAAVRYVGTPAVGTSQAAPAGGVATLGPANTEVDRRRRRIAWTAVAAFLVTWFIAFFRFFLPRTLFEPSTVFKIGYPSDYGLGVDTKWQQKFRIWVDRTPDRLFVIYARCTHLGCTPDWKPSENKFKCPCHGSGYDSEGVNFEGPAPRPMDRAHVELAPDGQIIVDTSRLYSWPKGQPSHFDDPGAFLQA